MVDPRNGDPVSQILVVDPDTQQVERTFQTRYLPDIAISPDGNRLYVAEIDAFDTRTWQQMGVFKPSDPAWQVALSRDGSQLYTVNPFKKSLSILDTATFTQVGVMHDLGDTPALIVVPPS